VREGEAVIYVDPSMPRQRRRGRKGEIERPVRLEVVNGTWEVRRGRGGRGEGSCGAEGVVLSWMSGALSLDVDG